MIDQIRFNTGAGQPQLATAPLPQVKAPAAPGEPQVAAVQPVDKPAVKMVDPQKMLDNLKEIVERLNQQLKDNNRSLGFSVDEAINTFVVTVRDSNTGEVVRQIPTDVVVKFAHSIEDMKGLLFNETQ